MEGSTRPRRRSMTDAFFFVRNPDAANVARGDLVSMLEEMRQREAHLDGFASSLPKLSESDLAALGHSDSTCPICLTSLLAILSEEEMASVMDSPAHPVEELGVTRLAQTCGHIFCRKDIRGWLFQGNTTCPTCRTPFIEPPAASTASSDGGEGGATGSGPGLGAMPPEASLAAFMDLQYDIAHAFGVMHPDGRAGGREAGGESTRADYDDDRSEFSSMYS
ncbi:uncharacterized protein BXZ73DRAFT_51216 [Epithele typhae]|uniref:uncharacterized protein n=1 Tax=Epithele typhae TaxID=378194 RepID=UPI00200750BB|nr:uncharacterized protein BXZ73DRAFT_51216 [Epithele typhae]KAH9922776.1 hypothetical protein BXZ73DRAFT_51216 [Epithele typhae]